MEGVNEGEATRRMCKRGRACICTSGVGRASYMGEGSACDVHGAGCVMGVWAEGEKRLEAGVGQGLGR